MPVDKPSLQRLLQRTSAQNIVERVVPLSINKKDKSDALSEFQKTATKMTNTSEVVLIAVKVS